VKSKLIGNFVQDEREVLREVAKISRAIPSTELLDMFCSWISRPERVIETNGEYASYIISLSHSGVEVIQLTKMTARPRRAAQNRKGIRIKVLLPGTHALSGRAAPKKSLLTSRLFIVIIKGSSIRLLRNCRA
jgi:hypothetical protein